MKIFIWGTGKIAERTCRECETLSSYEVLGFIDNDSKKAGNKFFGYEIYTPEVLNDITPDVIVVLSDAFDVIKRQIRKEFNHYTGSIQNKKYFYKEALLKRYMNTQEEEIKDVIKYIKRYDLHIFNYDFAKKYKNFKCEVFFDDRKKMFYVMHVGKKMFFPRRFKTEQEVEHYYRSIMLEQDKDSPHNYFSDSCRVKNGDVVVDAGVAEGNFSLEIVDRASKIYLIEADEQWVEALQYTFEDYKDKIKIICGYLSSYSDGNHIALDDVIDQPVNFIKMDIEGNEWDALNGAIELVRRSQNLRLSICSYHRDVDQELIESFMRKNEIQYEHSKGYMWFPYTLGRGYVTTKLTRGVIRGKKE